MLIFCVNHVLGCDLIWITKMFVQIRLFSPAYFCVKIASTELFIAQNESMTQLTHKLEEVCTTVPTAYQAICIYTVQQYLPTFIEEVEHELSPLVSCQEIGYCPENPTDSKRIDHSPPIKMKRANTERIASRLISIKSILNK